MQTILKNGKRITQQDTNDKEVVVEIQHLKKSFGNKVVLSDMNMKLYKGENLVVLGKSGSGKSVSIKCMVGLLTQDAGSLKIFGKEVKNQNDEELKKLRIKTGFLFQWDPLESTCRHASLSIL